MCEDLEMASSEVMKDNMVLIVGAGPAGLATAACLASMSVKFIILERENCTASMWKNLTYDCLHLHLPKEVCELPLLPFPQEYPRYPSRDQTVAYLDQYAQHFGIRPVFNTTVTSAEFSSQLRMWVVMAEQKGATVCFTACSLVVATGENGEPVMPLLPGHETFGGHSILGKEYKNGAKFGNQKVLVVGSGNTGMEIALDLANSGAKPTLVARRPVNRASNLFGWRCSSTVVLAHMFDTRFFIHVERCSNRGSCSGCQFYVVKH